MGDDESDEMALGGGNLRSEIGELINATGAISRAVDANRTEQALGLFGSANQSAQFHERLIQMGAPGKFRVQSSRFQVAGSSDELLGDLPEVLVGGFLLGIFTDGKQAGEQPNDIAVEDGPGFVEGDARNGTGGVAANARQFVNGFVTAREMALMSRDNFAGGLLHIADAGVIAKPFPQFVNGCGIGVGESLQCWQGTHPAFPIRDDGFDLRLLQHDFGNPNGVRIAATPPRKVAGVCRKPFE